MQETFTRKCERCHFIFHTKDSKANVCPSCKIQIATFRNFSARAKARHEEKVARQQEKQPAPQSTSRYKDKNLAPTRACHDCGKPTSDYRCSECWKKYRSASFYED